MNKLAIINSPIYPMITNLVNIYGLKTSGIEGRVKAAAIGFYSGHQELNAKEKAIKLK